MILNDTPQNEAVLSNVGHIGEFRIRNSAKAFSILSSGLYANKIRAIIRELSCNAVDSHTAADRSSTPFNIHLPNTVEPWFSIRDYGTGLNKDQVTNIYTTYFESTKTNSNAYIGALGLGSKSPFSYTDNFTITAIKDGQKGIYTAFINEHGVPSIALMMEEETSDPSGVEIKFSVNNRNDFNTFSYEAQHVFKYFKQLPVVTGAYGFQFTKLEYLNKDIVPGVHYLTGRSSASVAIMGNIAYPINVPEADLTINNALKALLACNLEMHFEIGELDFQASREGLSYIPQTINAIKKKLELLNSQLTIHLTKEADAIKNLWSRADFLYSKRAEKLWNASVISYITNTNFPLLSVNSGVVYKHLFKLSANDLASKYNISIAALSKSDYNNTLKTMKAELITTPRQPDGSYKTIDSIWEIYASPTVLFVTNELKTGATERVKFHCRATGGDKQIYILNKVDKTKDMDTVAFFKMMNSPTDSQRLTTGQLIEKEVVKKSSGKNVTILKLSTSSYNYGRRSQPTWRDAGKADSFDISLVHYYVPLSGYAFTSSVNNGYSSATDLIEVAAASRIPTLGNSVYGVRKSDINYIKTQKNWINFEEHVINTLSSLDEEFFKSMAKLEVEKFKFIKYNNAIAHISKDSPFTQTINQYSKIATSTTTLDSLKMLSDRYAPAVTAKAKNAVHKFTKECEAIRDRYPLLDSLQSSISWVALAEYINLIDKKESI